MDDELRERIKKLILGLKHTDGITRWVLVFALGNIAEENPGDTEIVKAVPALIEALKDENLRVGREAADALGKIAKMNHGNSEVKRVVPALIDCLKDGDQEVRRNAALALAKIGEPALGPVSKAYIEGKIRYEEFDAFCKALNEKLTEQGFDKGTVAPSRKKPDDLKRAIFRKLLAVPKPGLKRCIAGG